MTYYRYGRAQHFWRKKSRGLKFHSSFSNFIVNLFESHFLSIVSSGI